MEHRPQPDTCSQAPCSCLCLDVEWRATPGLARETAFEVPISLGDETSQVRWYQNKGIVLFCKINQHVWARCMYVCMYACIYSQHFQHRMDQSERCESCSWPAEQGKWCFPWHFPWPSSCLRIWSRETGSAVPSYASALILHILAESGAQLLPGQSRVNRVTQLRADGYNTESRPAQGQ